MDYDQFGDPILENLRDEGLFSRDFDGHLIRLEKATLSDYASPVHLWIDDKPVVVPKARPTTDMHGGIVLVDETGRTNPRPTTILDAAVQLFEEGIEDFREGGFDYSNLQFGTAADFREYLSTPKRPDTRASNPIHCLCHQSHMTPVAVCRVCSVEVSRPDSLRTELLPACYQPVSPLMQVATERTNDRVRQHVKKLVTLLAQDHGYYKRDFVSSSPVPQLNHATVLSRLCKHFDVSDKRLPSSMISAEEQEQKLKAYSSTVIQVDHSSCILCERCMRSCGEIKHNDVIGRRGKGPTARITFDLDKSLQYSSCVDCGECMISCPTDALSFQSTVKSQFMVDVEKAEIKKHGTDYEPLRMEDLKNKPGKYDPMGLFTNIPLRFLAWNQNAIMRRIFQPGETLCRIGDYGATAYVIVRGKLGIYVPEHPSQPEQQGNWFRQALSSVSSWGKTPQDGPEKFLGYRGTEDLIVGEMTCMNNHPRTATVRAEEETEVYEIRRNVLYMLQRDPVAREKLEAVYRARALQSFRAREPEKESRSNMFSSIPSSTDTSDDIHADIQKLLQSKEVQLLQADPGQIIFRKGALIRQLGDTRQSEGPEDNAMYVIRLGHVKFTDPDHETEMIVDYLGPRKQFGETALLSAMRDEMDALLESDNTDEDLMHQWNELCTKVLEKVPKSRTLTAQALDHVELIRIPFTVFRKMMHDFKAIREQTIRVAYGYVLSTQEARAEFGVPLQEFVNQGLYNADKLLVLDLEACTRCDECVKACADTHGGVTRLVRDGLRFDKFLVASACRACSDPYCLVGCPVDAIHRDGPASEIQIADHCIGCGQCAANCPYGNINMNVDSVHTEFDHQLGKKIRVEDYKATTCDLCRSVPSVRRSKHADVSCVYACPHEAAFRLSGTLLLEQVKKSAVQSGGAKNQTIAE